MNKSIITAIIIGSLIIGGGMIISQSMKQNSIEKQQKLELEAEQSRLEEQKREEGVKKLELSICIDKAERDYWSYMRLNGTEEDDGTIWASDRFWDRAEEVKQNDIDNCYKRFK